MKFFVLHLEVGVLGETWCSYLKPENEGDAPRCPACGRVVGSISTLPPYHIELKVYGPTPGDFARCPGDAVVMSGRFRTAWEHAQLRGLEFVPVERVRVRPARLGKKPLTYFHANPGRLEVGTRVDVDRSLIEYDRPITCPKCNGASADTIRGFSIDESSWTGEDMFYAWGLTGPIIVTDRVRQLRDEYGLTNVTLTPTEQYVRDPLNQWTPVDYSRDEPAPSDESISHNDTSSLN